MNTFRLSQCVCIFLPIYFVYFCPFATFSIVPSFAVTFTWSLFDLPPFRFSCKWTAPQANRSNQGLHLAYFFAFFIKKKIGISKCFSAPFP